jgi:hypothetical protein
MLEFGRAGATSRDEYRSGTGLRDPAPLVGVSQNVRARRVRPPGESLPRDEPLRIGNGLDPLADLLRSLDHDPLRAADVAEPVAVLAALQLADEFSAAGS